MGHNVWSQINAVQEANRKYDSGTIPKMLVQETFDRVYFRDVVERIFNIKDRDLALAEVEKHRRYFLSIIGTRGAIGKKTINASANFNKFFE